MTDHECQRQRTLAVVSRYFATLEMIDIDAFVELWAEDGIHEMPFSPPGHPNRLEGREAIRHRYEGLPAAFDSMSFDVALEPLDNPGKVMAVYHGTIRLTAGGTYDNTYVGLFEVEADRLKRVTEYLNPLVLQATLTDEQAVGRG